ncbi:MAG: DUF4240 domain-containing protein [Bacteroidota bacterium]
MAQTIHISVDNLDVQFLDNIKEQYPNASLEIKVNSDQQKEALQEREFWEIIDQLDWSQKTDELIILPAVDAILLKKMRHIYEFQDLLSKKLFQLDTKAHAQNVGENSYIDEATFFSVDEFLYARCCVVANGQVAFESVLEDPTKMPKNLTFEPLLSIAQAAYKLKTGREFNYVPTSSIETFANKKKWIS